MHLSEPRSDLSDAPRHLTYELLLAALRDAPSEEIRLATVADDPILIGHTTDGTPVMRARPVLVDGFPDLRVCNAPDCGASLAGKRRQARYCSDVCRQVAAKRRRRQRNARAENRQRIRGVVDEYLQQTRKRAARVRYLPPGVDVGDAIAEKSDVEIAALLRIVGPSPETSHRDDAMEHRSEADVDMAGLDVEDEREDDGHPTVLWCIRNRASGAGRLGHVTSRRTPRQNRLKLARLGEPRKEPAPIAGYAQVFSIGTTVIDGHLKVEFASRAHTSLSLPERRRRHRERIPSTARRESVTNCPIGGGTNE